MPKGIPSFRRNVNVLERFWNKIDIKSENECWEWKERLCRGYGIFKINSYTNIYAHIFAKEITTTLPTPLNILNCHICDNKKCCNPKHIFYGTQHDNMSDWWDKRKAI
jgi:hypothetical protein